MLWRIKNFKGVGEAQLDIQAGRTTVLTGINSSGKSSVIQSLLLVAQSLQYDNSLVLNGPLVRLGDAQDLVREGAENSSIQLTIGIEETATEDGAATSGHEATFDLTPSEDRASVRPRHLEVRAPGPDELPLIVGRENSRSKDVALAMAATAYLGAHDVLHLKSLLDDDKRQLRTYVAFKGLRPVALVQLMKPGDVASKYRALLESLLHPRETASSEAAKAATARAGRVTFLREFQRLILEGDITAARRLLDARFLDARFGSALAFEARWADLAPEDQDELVTAAVTARSTRPFVVLPIRPYSRGYSNPTGLLESQLIDAVSPTLEALNALSATLDTIAERVQYLGPLRDEPRVVWNHWNELARGLPVGTRGEYSAAVLSRSSATPVEYVTPEGDASHAPLADAVNRWLTYLEIGDTVAARSHGKLGVGLDLRVAGKVRDLTSVGVGVSQALPLLVGLLISPRGSMFIVEQPELHLHPAVQARLADFMLSARPDMTLLIETHSESFVTRLRRRAAEGSIDIGSVNVTFVEPGSDGSTTRVLRVSEYGDLSEWPAGFLSTSEQDVRAILSANVRRTIRN